MNLFFFSGKETKFQKLPYAIFFHVFPTKEVHSEKVYRAIFESETYHRCN